MESAGKVYAQNPDPETKLGDLQTMELSKLKILHHRYKNIVGNRKLLSRLKDGGESARRTLAAVQKELEARAGAEGGPPPLEGHRAAAAAAELEKLAQRMAQMEWTEGRKSTAAAERRADLDSDDDSEPEEPPRPTGGDASSPAGPTDSSSPAGLADSRSTAARRTPDSTSSGGSGTGAVIAPTRQLLHKCATSRRETRFATNRVRCPGNKSPAGPSPSPAPAPSPGKAPAPGQEKARHSVLSHWADSALAAPARPDTHTQLLDMDESLQLLTHHSRVTQEERDALLATRYAALTLDDMDGDYADMESHGVHVAMEGCHVQIEGNHVGMEAGSDDGAEDDDDKGPAVIVGSGDADAS